MKIELTTFFYSLILTISLVISACGQSSAQIEINCANLLPTADTIIETHGEWASTHYPDRLKEFKSDPISTGDIVMIGNSLTEQGQDWSVKLEVPNVKNRGISGDNTDGVLARLDEVICGAPSVIFVMIGTNDLWTEYSSKKVSENIDLIGRKLTAELPDALIFIQTVMPLAETSEKTEKVSEINSYLRAVDSPSYTLIDTHREMSNEQGYLPEEFTHDGVHLTPVGYEKWSNLLKLKLNEYN